MKQVTIENVKARMNELGQFMGRGGLSLREEFELACLRRLLASLEAEPVAWIIEGGNNDTPRHISTKKEYAEAYPDREVTPLYTAPPAPVAPDNKSITQHFDTIALETAREIMCDVNRRHEFLGGDCQLLSRIQCRIDDACRAAMQGKAEDATDNTAQQFEALAASQAGDELICHGERCWVCDEMILGESVDGLCIPCRDDLKSDPETSRGRDI